MVNNINLLIWAHPYFGWKKLHYFFPYAFQGYNVPFPKIKQMTHLSNFSVMFFRKGSKLLLPPFLHLLLHDITVTSFLSFYLLTEESLFVQPLTLYTVLFLLV